MSNLLFRMILFCQLQVAVGLLILPPAMSERGHGFLTAMEDKIEFLEQDGPPRIIVVGGSSVAFGVYSPRLAEEFGRPVINVGLHAALGMDFYIQLVQQHAREGDLVILLPEYAMLMDCPISSVYARNLLRQCPRAARYLVRDIWELKPFLDEMAISEVAFWTQAGTHKRWLNLTRWWENRGLEPNELVERARSEARCAALVRDRLRLRKRRPYTRYSFNEYGDMVGHHGAPPQSFYDRPLEWHGEAALRRSSAKLNRLAKVCKSKGVTVVFSYSPITLANYAESQTRYDSIHRTMIESLDIPVINCPKHVALPRDMFFDSHSHLTELGQKKRTEILVSSLNRGMLADNAAATKQRR